MGSPRTSWTWASFLVSILLLLISLGRVLIVGTHLHWRGMRFVDTHHFEMTVVLLDLEGLGTRAAQPKVLNGMRVCGFLAFVMKVE
jgi:hypothetical protein